MSTVTFNVGGKEFTISKHHVYKSRVLTNLTSRKNEACFLDYNYDAFAVVLDYIRHGRVLVPPTVNGETVELILDDLDVYISPNDHAKFALAASTNSYLESHEDDNPPLYTSNMDEKRILKDQKNDIPTGSSDKANLVDQLTITVHQKIADLIINTIRPRITSQALQGAYHTAYVLLPPDIKDCVLMSEFPNSKFTELVYLEKDVERFLAQPEVLRRFEDALRQNLEAPMTIERKDVFFRSENEFGIYGTTTIQALVIEFELGRQL